MKEKDLLACGFKRQNETMESSGSDKDWYYYTLDIGDLCLISNSSDDVKKDKWKVYLLDYNDFCLDTLEKVAEVINALKGGLK